MTTRKTASKSKDVKQVETVETVTQQVNESEADQTSDIASSDESPVLEKKVQDHTSVVIPYYKEFAQRQRTAFRSSFLV